MPSRHHPMPSKRQIQKSRWQMYFHPFHTFMVGNYISRVNKTSSKGTNQSAMLQCVYIISIYLYNYIVYLPVCLVQRPVTSLSQLPLALLGHVLLIHLHFVPSHPIALPGYSKGAAMEKQCEGRGHRGWNLGGEASQSFLLIWQVLLV